MKDFFPTVGSIGGYSGYLKCLDMVQWMRSGREVIGCRHQLVSGHGIKQKILPPSSVEFDLSVGTGMSLRRI